MVDILENVPLREAKGFQIPALGLIGVDAVREAFEGDLRQLQDLLQGAIKKALELSGEDDWWPYVHGLFDDFIVVESKDGKLLRYAYSVDGTNVSLGNPQEVIKTFEPAKGSGQDRLSEALAGAFLEGDSESGARYRIRVIQAGLSGNGNFYPDAVLKESLSLFEGARVFVKSDAEHLSGQGKDVRNLIGVLKTPEFIEGVAADSGEVHADLLLIEPEGVIGVKLREAWNHQLTELFGFSIDARAHCKIRNVNGQRIREAVKFTKVNSVDLIVEPGAGGGIINLLEAKDDKVMNREEIIALLEAKGLLKGKQVDKLSDSELTSILTEAVGPAAGDTTETTVTEAIDDDSRPVTAADLRMIEARASARTLIAGSNLPAAAKAKLQTRFEKESRFTEAEVSAAIKDEADYIAGFTESGTVQGLGTRIESGETRPEKIQTMLEAFFDPEHKDHRHARSFKECYAEITGDSRVTGMIRDCNQARMTEALDSSSFDDVLGNAMTRRLLKDYNAKTTYDVWRELTGTPVPLQDFRTNERTRFGGYGDLPKVAESADYTALTSPTDEKATYAPEKRGGTETITLEMIKNDDVGVIRQIPIKMSRAAKRTLGKFVLDFLVTNPTIYDGIALFHASHGNLGAAALSKASLAAGRLAMLKQQEPGSNDQLGIAPRKIWVASDLEETAVDLFRRNTENDKNFIQSLSLDVVPVWYWTDADDWVLSADPMDLPIIELGFLDGQEEPELFVQDSPTSGSMFSNDKITYKIRHIYGGNVVDFRGLFKGVVP